MIERDTFIRLVAVYLEENPDVFPAAMEAATHAIRDRLRREAEAKTATEAALIAALARRSKKNDELLIQMIEKMQPTASFNYDSIIEELRS